MELFRITKHLLSLMIKNRIVNAPSINNSLNLGEFEKTLTTNEVIHDQKESHLVPTECNKEDPEISHEVLKATSDADVSRNDVLVEAPLLTADKQELFMVQYSALCEALNKAEEDLQYAKDNDEEADVLHLEALEISAKNLRIASAEKAAAKGALNINFYFEFRNDSQYRVP
jgi:hypothetical protein